MKNVWESCTFSNEIISGDLKLHKFAIELYEFLAGEGDQVYQDPKTFFENTYLTTQMKSILKDSLLRLSKGEGIPVTVIDTGFGGGKTHTIMLLYHILKNPKLGFEYISKYGLDKECAMKSIPDVNVVAIDCRDIKKNTLWGEIANLLGKYDQVKDYDINPRPISNIEIIRSLFDKPTLLLIDELPHYLVEAKAEKIGGILKSDLTLAFLMKLISSISTTDKSCFILTLTANQQLYKEYTNSIEKKLKTFDDFEDDKIVSNMRETISRQPLIVNPVTREQIYDVVRQRLIRDIDQKSRDETVNAYYNYYVSKGMTMPPDFKDRLKKSYPFHPVLIDILYERVSTITNFNQTRGVLRLLALVLRHIYQQKLVCNIVGTGQVALSEQDIADELTSKIGKNELKKIIDTDCVAHAREIDAQKNIKIAEVIARTLYLDSLHEQVQKKGMKKNEIRLAVCYPDLDPSLVDKALDEDIDRNFWYIRTKDHNEYYFVEQANVNAIIHEHEKEVNDNEIRRQIEFTLNNLVKGGPFQPIIWDEHELVDNKNLKIFVIDYKKDLSSDSDARTYASRNLGYLSNGTIRNNGNTIVFLYPDQNGIATLRNKAGWVVAIKKAIKDERVKADKDFIDTIKIRDTDAEGNLERECFTVYCKIAYPDGVEPRLDAISHLDTTSPTISGAIVEMLKKKGKLIDSISVDGLAITKPKKISDIYDEFTVDKSKKFLLKPSSILDAIKDGIHDKKFGYSEKLEEVGGKYDAQIGVYLEPSYDGYVINSENILQKVPIIQEPPKPPGTISEVKTYQYRIKCADIGTIIKNLGELVITSVDFPKIKKSLHADLRVGDGTTIIIDSDLKGHEIKTILSNLKSYAVGNGYLTISSDDDLHDHFKDQGIDFE